MCAADVVGLRGNVLVCHVYLSRRMPKCCSSSIAVEYFLLPYGQCTCILAIGFHVSLCALA